MHLITLVFQNVKKNPQNSALFPSRSIMMHFAQIVFFRDKSNTPSSHENKFNLQQIKQSTPPPTPEEEILPPPPVAARPEKTKSIVSTDFDQISKIQFQSLNSAEITRR